MQLVELCAYCMIRNGSSLHCHNVICQEQFFPLCVQRTDIGPDQILQIYYSRLIIVYHCAQLG